MEPGNLNGAVFVVPPVVVVVVNSLETELVVDDTVEVSGVVSVEVVETTVVSSTFLESPASKKFYSAFTD